MSDKSKFDTPVGCECGECKRCKNRLKAKRWREENKERTQQYYIDNKERINEVTRKWKEDNPDLLKKQRKEYQDREDVRQRRSERERYVLQTDPEARKKKNVRKMVQRAVRSGKILRGDCEVCGAMDNIHAHHDDYDKPFDVRWLCSDHHVELHKNINRGSIA